MKLKTTLIGFLVAAGGFASAASVLSSNIEVEVSSPLGDPVDAMAYVGWIDTTTADLTTLEGIMSAFQPLGSSFTANYAGTYSGLWGDQQIDFTNADGVAGKNVFHLFVSGLDFGLIEDTTVQFLADEAIPNSNSAPITQGKFDGSDITVHAGNYSATGGTNTSAEFNLVQGIPEPSVMLLGSLGLVGLLRRRR